MTNFGFLPNKSTFLNLDGPQFTVETRGGVSAKPLVDMGNIVLNPTPTIQVQPTTTTDPLAGKPNMAGASVVSGSGGGGSTTTGTAAAPPTKPNFVKYGIIAAVLVAGAWFVFK